MDEIPDDLPSIARAIKSFFETNHYMTASDLVGFLRELADLIEASRE